MQESLDELRQALAAVDRGILGLVAERAQLAARIGRVKYATGQNTRNFRQERVVIERARAVATELGVAPDLAATLVGDLIRSSLQVQEHDRVIAEADGGGRSVLVIGGAGKMGRWFAQFLQSQGYQVTIADPVGPVPGFACVQSWRDVTLNHSIIVVAAPLRVSGEILLELAKAPPSSLIFDVGSLKTPLKGGLQALMEAGAQVTSLHPMFGPDTHLLSGRNVIFVEVGCPQATARARALFDSTMAIPVEMDLESHDRVIAFVLGLSHALNITFFTALSQSGEAVPRLSEVSSTTFDAQLAVATSVSQENPHLYYEIQALNAYGLEALSALGDAVAQLREAIESGNEDAFVDLMQRGREYLETTVRPMDSPQ